MFLGDSSGLTISGAGEGEKKAKKGNGDTCGNNISLKSLASVMQRFCEWVIGGV